MLHLHRSERADLLVQALADVVAEPLPDPMAAEVVSVPTRGVERWIAQTLSHRLGTGPRDDDGVCANVSFPFPGRLVAEAASAACGCPSADDWWAPERTVWPLMALMDEHMDDPLIAPLAQHLRAAAPMGPSGQVRRFGAARRMADLYDRYGVHRPHMLTGWLAAGPGAAHPGLGEDSWQAYLWLMLRGLSDVPSPAERFELAPGLLAAGPELVDLPERISVFGLTRLPASHLGVLKALAQHREVHLFLLHPSAAMWQKVATALERSPRVSRLREHDATERLPAHPLLRSWARDAREMQLVLAAEGVGGGRGGDHRAPPGAPATLLGLVQSAIWADMAPPGPPAPGEPDARAVLAPGDDSLVAHSCHGRARQVEVAREAVLHLLAHDPTLEPRHVIVMCPDIEVFAPLVQAAFGPMAALAGPQGTGPAELRARLADRSLRQTNPMLAVAARLLDLAGSRVTASAVLDFASQAPVARRFQLDEDDLSAFQRWLAGTGARWGLDAAYRRPWKLDNLADGTWEVGLDRLALGVAMAGRADQVYAGLLPFGDVSATEVGLVGRVCELEDRLATAVSRLSGYRGAAGWAEALALATLELAEATPGEAWETEQLHLALSQVTQPAVGHGTEVGRDGPLLDLAEARALFAGALQGRPTRANFRTGDMTVCTLVPMRSVPHRVVCLVGLDDGVFPRHSAHDGDDLLSAQPEVGDRDVPSEDRQLLLDALLAATEHLVITFEGRDQHVNQRRPPAVTVDELLDVVDQTVRLEGTSLSARHRVVVEHPLQPFDPRNFTAGALGHPGPWRFDPVNLEGARALCVERRPTPGFLGTRLAPASGTTVRLDSLVRFLEHPVKAFLRERLGYFGSELPDRLNDALPVELAPLERWALGDRLLEAYLREGDLEPALCAELGRGLLPPGDLREPILAEVVSVIAALADELSALPCAAAPPEATEVEIALADGTVLTGRVPGVRQGTVLRCTFSKTRAKHRLRAWAHFLALTAAYPGQAPSAVTLTQAEGSRPSKPRVSVAKLAALEGDAAQRQATATSYLEGLVGLYRLGMCEPLPLYCATSAAWAAARVDSGDARQAAQAQWGPGDVEERPAEGGDLEHVLVLGARTEFVSLLQEPPGAGDPGGSSGLAAGEGTRFGRLALALWEPLLHHERRLER